MNRARLRRLARRFDRLPARRFNMWNYFGPDCCVASHAAILSGAGNGRRVRIPERAREWLGLSPEQSYRLFIPNRLACFAATPRIAAKVVRRLIRTGRVEWERFI